MSCSAVASDSVGYGLPNAFTCLGLIATGTDKSPFLGVFYYLRFAEVVPASSCRVEFLSNGLLAHFLFVTMNPMASIQEQLTKILAPVVESLDCNFWGVEYFPKGRDSLLRVYIDKPEGIAVEDCERVSRQVSSVLDVEDPIRSEYTLEVSSPGMDRPLFSLEQYQQSIGEKINLRLRVAFEGRRRFVGLLKAVENDEIVLEVGDEEFLLPYELIDKANIVPQF